MGKCPDPCEIAPQRCHVITAKRIAAMDEHIPGGDVAQSLVVRVADED
jgi:hypothetical protein